MEPFALESIEVSSPCPMPWERMQGNERVRFCNECNLRVYNLSGMERAEAEALVASHEGSLCVRLLRRQDGTVLTRECPAGWRALRRRLLHGMVTLASLAFALVFGTNSGQTAAPPPRKLGPPESPQLQAPRIPRFGAGEVTLGRFAPGKGPGSRVPLPIAPPKPAPRP